jgi:hypothetical protein
MSGQRPFPNSDAVMLKTVNLIDNKGSMSVLSHDVLTGNSIAEYSKNSGVVYGNPNSFFDFDLAGLAEKLYIEFYNSPQNVRPFMNSINLSDDNINFENVFHKFRGCLDMYRVAFADAFDMLPVTIGSTKYDVAYFKQSPTTLSPTSLTLTYVDMTITADVKTMVEMLESIKNKVLDILKKPAAAATSTTTAAAAASPPAATSTAATPSATTAASTSTTASTASTAASPASPPPPNFSSLNYNVTLTNIDKDDFKIWSAKEVGILEEPQNHESVLYVIGQVFNIIDPTHYKSFLTDKPSTSSSASSLSSISKTNFFQFIVKDPNITSISKDGTLYVGETKDYKKEGKGMMRWANGNIFEGTFANDSIEKGTFRKNDGTTDNLVSSNATTGAAKFGTVDGTFNMDNGKFTPPTPPTPPTVAGAGP